MSTTATAAAPEATVVVNPKISKAVAELIKKETAASVAFDNLRTVSLRESVANSYTKKQLTAMLLELMSDPARASEVAGFVFPNHSAARAELDKALAFNAKQTDAKKRISKQIILALQRDNDGTLTLEKAIENAKKPSERTPGGETNQTTTSTTAPATTTTPATSGSGTPVLDTTPPVTPVLVDDRIGDFFAAGLNLGKANGYDEADLTAIFEGWILQIFPVSEGEEEGDPEMREEGEEA